MEVSTISLIVSGNQRHKFLAMLFALPCYCFRAGKQNHSQFANEKHQSLALGSYW